MKHNNTSISIILVRNNMYSKGLMVFIGIHSVLGGSKIRHVTVNYTYSPSTSITLSESYCEEPASYSLKRRNTLYLWMQVRALLVFKV